MIDDNAADLGRLLTLEQVRQAESLTAPQSSAVEPRIVEYTKQLSP